MLLSPDEVKVIDKPAELEFNQEGVKFTRKAVIETLDVLKKLLDHS